MFACVYACDPPSDLEKPLHQSEDSEQLGNTLHNINNLMCASCMHNYNTQKQQHGGSTLSAPALLACTPWARVQYSRWGHSVLVIIQHPGRYWLLMQSAIKAQHQNDYGKE